MSKRVEFNLNGIITQNEYNNIIKDLSNWYQEKISYVKSLYDEMLETKELLKAFDVTKIHNEIVVELIKKIVNLLNIDEESIGIYLSNSFAKCTNLIDSDIDLNFIYEDENLKVYEELISSILFCVLDKYRDFIHDSIAHRFVTSELNENDDLDIVLNFEDGTIKYRVTKGNINLMHRLLTTNNKLDSHIKYYLGYINSKTLNNWVYFQKHIYGKNASNMLDYIATLESGIRNNNLEDYKNYIINNIQDELNYLSENKIDDISQLKRYYKNHAYRIIYNFLTFLDKINNKEFKYKTIPELIDEHLDSNLASLFKEYFGSIMMINHICNLYGIEFRTRYNQHIKEDFLEFYKDKMGYDLFDNLNKRIKDIYSSILKHLNNLEIKNEDFIFNAKLEHINIPNYSPLSHINNVSKEYHDNYFLLPIISYDSEFVPVHPDTFTDLCIDKKCIVDKKIVYPTSSTRTVYDGSTNTCYKLAVLRQITRSIRDVSNKEITRSELATEYLSKYSYQNFFIIPEDTHKFPNEIFNYIERKMPDKKVYPWFYLIMSNKFSKEFMINVIRNLVSVWMFYASKGIYFESFHTQNLLVDEDGFIYYRDLSDIRILSEQIMMPSYINELKDESELHSIFFDRSLISQNLEYFIKYRKDITDEDIELIKEIIRDEMNKYNIDFPDYSMNYDKNRSGHHPIKCELVSLRRL